MDNKSILGTSVSVTLFKQNEVNSCLNFKGSHKLIIICQDKDISLSKVTELPEIITRLRADGINPEDIDIINLEGGTSYDKHLNFSHNLIYLDFTINV